MSDSLHRKAARFRQRRITQDWERRQRHHTKGSWLRVQRVLADAETAYEIADADADALLAEGFKEEEVGLELHPARRWIFVPFDRIELIVDRKPLDLHLNTALITAPCLALIRWPFFDESE